MPRALDASSYIYEGVWTDWSRSRGLSTVLTLSPSHAAILSPAIAIIIAIAGTQLWILTRFALHQLRATSEAQDFLYHQQQVTLRNNSTDLNALWRFLRMGFAWRHQNHIHAGRRSIGLMLATLAHLLFVVLSGLFSSSLLNAGDRVLSRSPYCGLYNSTYFDTLATETSQDELMVDYLTNAQSRYSLSKQYVQFCNSTSEGCETLPYNQLPWSKTILEKSCPFDLAACSNKSNNEIVFDTGYLSSHTHLGLNAPPNERVAYRKVTRCAAMNDQDYITDWMNVSSSDTSEIIRVVDARYGPTASHERNATYSYSDYARHMAVDQYHDIDPYVLDVKFAAAGSPNASDFIPISQLDRSDADIILMFLSFNAVYDTLVEDPWFSATLVQDYAYNNWNERVNGTFYVRERPVTTLACTEQHQFCAGDRSSPNDNTDECTPLLGQTQVDWDPDYNPNITLKLSDAQWTAYRHIFTAAVESSIYSILVNLNQADLPLLARPLIKNNVGLGLPNNQWQKEAEYWQTLSMAMFQHAIIDWSTGQFAADISYINTTGTPTDHQLCRNQVIRSKVYRSFKFTPLMLILVIASLIIIAGLTIEECIGSWRLKKLRYGTSKQDMWILNGDLEMLRLLSEAHTGAVWSHNGGGIPLAEPGHKFQISRLRNKSQLRPTTRIKSRQYNLQKMASKPFEDQNTSQESLVPRNEDRSAHEQSFKDNISYFRNDFGEELVEPRHMSKTWAREVSPLPSPWIWHPGDHPHIPSLLPRGMCETRQ